MTDHTNECKAHEKHEKMLETNEIDIQNLHADVRDCWTAIKQKVDFDLSWKVWAAICIFTVILFGIVSNNIASVEKDNACMVKIYYSIDKRLQRIEDKAQIKPSAEIDWNE